MLPTLEKLVENSALYGRLREVPSIYTVEFGGLTKGKFTTD